jgi:hypothetical protein
LKALRSSCVRIVDRALLGKSWVAIWDRCAPRTAKMRRVSHQGITETLRLHERHVVFILKERRDLA